MPVLIVIWFVSLFSMFFWGIQNDTEMQERIVKFEQRCKEKGALTLQSIKNGSGWIGCYKDGKELDNEE